MAKTWGQRQRELARGVDANLIRDNNRKFQRAFASIAVGILVWLVDDKVHLRDTLHTIVVIIGFILFFGGALVAMYALRERMFLESP